MNITIADGHEAFTSEDIPVINTLLQQLSPNAPQFRNILDVHERLRGKLAITARDGERLIGMAIVTNASTLSGDRALVDDVVVLEEYRGKGVGRLLMQAVDTAAYQLGARDIELTSKPSREAANALYLSMGYELRKTNPYRKRFY